jgi:predicted secreted protein
MVQAGMRGLYLEASSEIELHPGDKCHQALGSLGSAGYAWEFEVYGPEGVIRVYQAPPGLSSIVEASVLQTYSVEHNFIIEALELGKAEVRFVLRRPWEKDVPPVQVMAVRVAVVR